MSRLNKIGIKWLNQNYGNLEPFETEKYPDYIFYMRNGKVIFEYNKKNGVVFVNYDEIWSFFESYFSMSYQQIKDIIKIWVEEHYKLRVSTTWEHLLFAPNWVEEHYKLRVSTTPLEISTKKLWWRNITN